MTNEHGVVHFEIAADDPEKLSQFYSELFGWQIQKMDMGGQPYYMTSTVATGEQGPITPGAINGGITPRMMPDQRVTNYVNVEDVPQYVEKAKALGATEVMGAMAVPNMGYFAVLIDPQGNPLGLWKEDSSAH